MPFAAALSTALDARQAVDETAAEVERQFGDAQSELVVAFISPHHADSTGPIARLLHGRLQPRCLIGCVGESIVGNRREIEGDPALAVWAGTWDGKVEIEAFQLSMSETSEGISLLGWPDGLIDADPGKSLMLTLGDPFSFPTTDIFLPRLNEDHPTLAVVGGMSSNPAGPTAGSLLLNGDTVADGAVGVLLRGDFPWRSVVSQGCRPIGRPLVITKGEGNVISELGGLRPVDYLRGLYDELSPADRNLFERGLLLGLAISEYRDQFTRGDFLIRNLLGLDRASGAMAVNDRIRVGQTVQFQVRDGNSADEDLRHLLAQQRDAGFKPAAGLLFTCNGRGTRMFAEPNHDAGSIQNELGPVPLAGFFAAGELGPVGGRNFIHGFTASAVFFG